MTTLYGRSPLTSYQGTLQLGSGALSSSLTVVQDGLGNATPLQLSTSTVSINGLQWPASAGSTGQALVISPTTGQLAWTTLQTTIQSSDVTNALGYTPANIASPTFTGVPAGPTATPGTNTTQFATTAFVTSAISAYAPLVTSVAGRTGAIVLSVADVSGAAPSASPTFTGTPIAPTATAGTNTTQLATTAFVTSAIAAYAPLVTSVAGRTGAIVLSVSDITGAAPLASPALTGIPTAPTASLGTVTTQLATTAFVGSTAANYLPLAGGVLSGPLTTSTNGITFSDGTTQITANGATAPISTLYNPAQGTTVLPVNQYAIGFIQVYQNGVRLVPGVDFTATDGSNVVLTQPSGLKDAYEVLTGVIYTPTAIVTPSSTLYTVTASGLTTFPTPTYTVGFLSLFFNGSRLILGVDFTASTGNSVTFINGYTSVVGDTFEYYILTPFAPTTAVTQSALQSNQYLYGVESGATANAFVLNTTPSFSTLIDGMTVYMLGTRTNTATSTLNVNGTGALTIYGAANTLQSGEITSNGNYQIQYNARLNGWRMIGQSGGFTQVGPGIQSYHAVNRSQVAQVSPNYNATNFSPAASSTTNTSVTITAPGNGYILAMAHLNVSSAMAAPVTFGLIAFPQNTVLSSDTTSFPMNHSSFITAVAGSAYTLTAQTVTGATSPNTNMTAHVTAFFIPSP